MAGKRVDDGRSGLRKKDIDRNADEQAAHDLCADVARAAEPRGGDGADIRLRMPDVP